MELVCLDLEGVLIPEIWINFAIKTGIEELKLTTRDISDYNVLMKKRLGILAENNLKLKDIEDVIGSMNPFPGALDFTEELRSKCQLIILSDTFTQFARPMMKKLSWPTLFCNTLKVEADGTISDYTLRQQDGKRKAVEAFRTTGCRIFAAGDSFNDTTMLKAADQGVLFRSPESIQKKFPQFKALTEYKDLMGEIETFLRKA